MLKTLINYIYFSFIFLFIFLIFLNEKFNLNFYNLLVVLYFALFLPFFDYLFEYLKKELIFSSNSIVPIYEKIINLLKNVYNKYKKYFEIFFAKSIEYKKIFFLFIFCFILYNIFGNNLYNYLTILFLIMSIYLKIDSRVSFFMAFILIIFNPIFLILEKQQNAEIFSIYSYYFLVIGIIIFVFEFFNLNIILAQKFPLLKDRFISYLYFIKLNNKTVFIDLIYTFFVFFVLAFYFDFFYQNIINFFVFLIFVYILFKFFGYLFEFKFTKINLIDGVNFNFYIIFFSVNLMIYSAIFNKIDINNKIVYSFVISSLLLIIFLLIFSNLFEMIKKVILNNIYATLVILTIFLFFIGNNYFNNVKDDGNTIPHILVGEKEDNYTEENNTNELQNPLSSEDINKIENNTNTKKFDISMFQKNIGVGSKGEIVKNLQLFLNEYGYYNFEINGVYDLNTQLAMKNFLIKECSWSEANKGVLGPLARECIKNVLLSTEK